MPLPDKDPLIERIIKNVIETIQAVRPDDGYYLSYVVDRPHPRNSDAYSDRRVLVVQGLEQQQEEMSQTCSLVLQQFVTLRVDAVLSSRSESESVDRRLNLMRADMIKAMLADRQRGQLAITTEYQVSELSDETIDTSQGRVDVTFTITYQQSWRDPTAF